MPEVAAKPEKKAPGKRMQPRQSQQPGQSQQPSLMQDILGLLIKLFAILTALVLIFTFLFGIFLSRDMSMKPAIQDGDIVVYYRLAKHFVSSDVVVVEYEGEKQVRRVLAIGGDTVDITDEGLFINGAYIASENQQEILLYEDGITFPVTLEQGELFLLADVRSGAIDSRLYGVVETKDVLGKVHTIIRQRNI